MVIIFFYDMLNQGPDQNLNCLVEIH